MLASSTLPGARLARVVLWGLLALLLACATVALAGPRDGLIADALGKWGYNVVLVGAASACLARAMAVRAERLAWSVIGVGALLWALGNVYYTAVLWDLDPIPIPSPSDLLWLTFYPLSYVGVVLLLRSRGSARGASLWLDGAVSALAVAAFGAASVFERVLDSTGGAATEVATNLAYPLGDTVLLGVVTGAVALGGWQVGRVWGLFAAGFVLFGLSDSLYLAQNAVGDWTPGSIVEAGWPAGFLLIAFAAWQRPERPSAVRADRRRELIAPIAFGLLGLGLLVSDHFSRLNLLAVTLSWLCVLALLGRFALTFAFNVAMLRSTREEALTDALCGLGNRRRLQADLEAAFADGRPHVLALFDLNGFKGYNDTFGHPAGDMLLRRLSASLDAAVGPLGRAYRMGGDEFCVLTRARDAEALDVVARCRAALVEEGDGFSVTAASGSVLLPDDAPDPAAALGRADRRMYADKAGGRRTAAEETTGVLLRALSEHHPDLDAHLQGVSDRVEAVGRELGLHGRALEDVRRAGELHDIGKIAVPGSILDKPGRLSAEEWAFIERHTVIGERILLSAPSLSTIAALVRSSHERVDGTGYPDRLTGAQIPLGALIVAACDAYDAMVSDRPYRAALSPEEAAAELRRCSGTQFDPRVVTALLRVVAQARHPVG